MRIDWIVNCSDNPNTNSVAVLIVHESFMSQYKKELDVEQKQMADLRKQLETRKFFENNLLRISKRYEEKRKVL